MPIHQTHSTNADPRLSTARDAAVWLLQLAANNLHQLPSRRSARHGCIRGTGPGVSFGELITRLEQHHPIELVSPFEGSERVAGGVLHPKDLGVTNTDAAIAKLRWDTNARDLPMHVHEHSARFIVVLEGRGFHHVSRQSLDVFDGSDVTTIAARERDVFCFTRGVVHTFSTTNHPMTLLSIQLPFIPFDDPRQYTLPGVRWTAATHLDPADSRVACHLSTRLV